MVNRNFFGDSGGHSSFSFSSGSGGAGGFPGGFAGRQGQRQQSSGATRESRRQFPFSQQDGITEIKSSNYPSSRANRVWILQFFARLNEAQKSRLVDLAKKLTPQGFKIGAVNCESERDLCNSKASSVISGGKPVLILRAGSKEVEYDEENSKSLSIAQFLVNEVPSEVQNLRLVSHIEEFTSLSKYSKASYGVGLIYITSKFDTAVVLKALAFQLKGKVSVGEVRGAGSNSKVLEAFGVKQQALPVLLAVCAGDDLLVHESFRGDLKSFDEITAFVDKFSDKRRCSDLKADVKQERDRKRIKAQELVKLSPEQLNRKKLSELKEAVHNLGISTVGLLEKDDYVHAIRDYKISQETITKRQRTKSSDSAGGTTFSSQQEQETERKSHRSEGQTSGNVDLEDLDPSELLKKKLSELSALIRELGIATKGMLEKSEYVKAIADYVKTHKQNANPAFEL